MFVDSTANQFLQVQWVLQGEFDTGYWDDLKRSPSEDDPICFAPFVSKDYLLASLRRNWSWTLHLLRQMQAGKSRLPLLPLPRFFKKWVIS